MVSMYARRVDVQGSLKLILLYIANKLNAKTCKTQLERAIMVNVLVNVSICFTV